MPGAVELGGEHALGQCHADRVGKPLPQGAGGHLNPGGHTQFGVPRGNAAPLPEVLEGLERQVVPGEVQQRVEQGRCVTGGQHEAVAVRPCRVARGMSELSLEDAPGDGREAHRCSGMPGVRLLDGVYSEGSYGGDAEVGRCRLSHVLLRFEGRPQPTDPVCRRPRDHRRCVAAGCP